MVLDTSDISGATSRPLYRFLNRPEKEVIAGATPASPFREATRPVLNLTCDDIPGCQGKGSDVFKRSRRRVNPLTPAYDLATSKPGVDAPTPKQVRASLDVKDIEKTSASPLYPWAQRQTLSVADLPGAQRGTTTLGRAMNRPPRSPSPWQQIGDINSPGFKSKRQTNPLSPRYTVGMTPSLFPCTPGTVDPSELSKRSGSNATVGSEVVLEIGSVQGNHPKKLARTPRNAEHHQTLNFRDVPRSYAGWRSEELIHRRQWRNTNYIGDVKGASPKQECSAHKIGMFKLQGRRTDPVMPAYCGLDGTVQRPPAEQPPPAVQPSEKASYMAALARIHDKMQIRGGSLRTNFLSFDLNRDGVITETEFRKGVARTGVPISEADMRLLIQHVDKDGSGVIDYNEFLAMEAPAKLGITPASSGRNSQSSSRPSTASSVSIFDPYEVALQQRVVDKAALQALQDRIFAKIPNNTRQGLLRCFRTMDTDNSGQLDQSEFGKAVCNMGLGITENQARRIARAVDTDGSNKIDYDEFARSFVRAEGGFDHNPFPAKGEVDRIVSSLAERPSTASSKVSSSRSTRSVGSIGSKSKNSNSRPASAGVLLSPGKIRKQREDEWLQAEIDAVRSVR